MLHITGSMRALKQELQTAHSLVKDIIGSLSNVNEKTDLTKEIGIYTVQMPNFKILSKDADSARNLIRRVCTGEVTPQDALEKFKAAHDELKQLFDYVYKIAIFVS